MNAVDKVQDLIKALEAGNYNAAPGDLVQGAALQREDLSPVLQNLCFQDKHIKLQQMLESSSCKSLLAQFDRQLSYGTFGGSAVLEGNIGAEQTSDFVRITVPMAFYAQYRRYTLQTQMVATVDGKSAEERTAEDAAKSIAGDIEFDLFRGRADFSNGGVFDGNPLAIPQMPNMMGLDQQVRESDAQRSAQDLMFASFGSSESVVINGGGPLSQENVEDAMVRSVMNMGEADLLLVDPKVRAAYNKLTYGKERIVLAGSPQHSTGAELNQQWTSSGTAKVDYSRFLSGKTGPNHIRSGAPLAPSISVASVTVAGVVTAFLAGEVYTYYATSENEIGESQASASATGTVLVNGDELQVTITHPSGTNRFYNVYRSAAGGTAASAKFIGRVIQTAGSATTIFYDLGNKLPGFSTGFLVQKDTMEIKELAPFTRMKLAISDLSVPEAYYRFCCLVVYKPRMNVLVDNLI